jgi:hypothetical protein
MIIEKDKILHFVISFLLVNICSFFINLPITLVIVFIIGFIKELYDFFIFKRKDCLGDIIADILGIIYACIIIIFLKVLLFYLIL